MVRSRVWGERRLLPSRATTVSDAFYDSKSARLSHSIENPGIGCGKLDNSSARRTAVARKVEHELMAYAIVSVYLYVWFGALLLYKTAIRQAEGTNYLPYGVAAIKALILGKFILGGNAAGLGDRYAKRRPIYVIIHKGLL
jgi:hypothetical protein